MVPFLTRTCEQLANKKVSLYRKCKTPEGWKHYPAAMSQNGKVKTDTVVVEGVEVEYPAGHYELRSFEGSKTKWTRLKGNGTDALAALKTAQKMANAVAVAGDAGVKVVTDTKRVVLKTEAIRFAQAALARGSNEAAEMYQRTLDDFLTGCSKVYADELTHADVLKFHAQMRGRGLADRTVHNRHMYLRSFLLTLGFSAEQVKTIAGKKAPKYEKTMPEIYEPADLKAFFASLKTDYDKLLFDLLLTTGLREREAMDLEWVDISYTRKTLQVRSKPHYGHKIKDSEEREMPLTNNIIKQLQRYREEHANHRLIFGKRGGADDAPDGHLLRRLKGLVEDAGLNCGTCSTCVAEDGCERWFLHKFRANYITTLLRDGLDLRSTMALSGHNTLESVMRYLRPADGVEVQKRVNSIKWR
jgi:integrase